MGTLILGKERVDDTSSSLASGKQTLHWESGGVFPSRQLDIKDTAELHSMIVTSRSWS